MAISSDKLINAIRLDLTGEYKDKIPNNLYEALINWKPDYQKCA